MIISYIFCYFKFSIVFFTNSSYDKFRQRQYNFAWEKQIHLFQCELFKEVTLKEFKSH